MTIKTKNRSTSISTSPCGAFKFTSSLSLATNSRRISEDARNVVVIFFTTQTKKLIRVEFSNPKQVDETIQLASKRASHVVATTVRIHQLSALIEHHIITISSIGFLTETSFRHRVQSPDFDWWTRTHLPFGVLTKCSHRKIMFLYQFGDQDGFRLI